MGKREGLGGEFMHSKQEFNFENLFKFIPLNISSESELTCMNKIKCK